MLAVSVILPTYNRAELLSRAIESVLAQTYRNFELIVIDDASTDDTERVVEKFGDPRVRFIRQDVNMGAAAARNTGIRAAGGEFIAFQDSDDEWLPEKLEIQVDILRNAPTEVGVVYSNMVRVVGEERTAWPTPVVVPEDGIVYRDALYRLLNIGIQTSLIKRECFSRIGMFDEGLRGFEDFEIFIRLSKYYCFSHVNKSLSVYYDTENSISSNCEALFSASEAILEKYHDDIVNNRRALAKYLFVIGNDFCKKRDLEHGRTYLFRAARIRPWNLVYVIAALVSVFGLDTFVAVSRVKGRIEQSMGQHN